MTHVCVKCRRTRVDLERPPDLEKARLIFDELVALGGIVHVQKTLVDHLWEAYEVSHGTTVRFVNALWATGHVAVQYYREGVLKKRVIAVRRP